MGEGGRTSGRRSSDSLPASMRSLVPGRSPCTSLYCATCMRRNRSGCSDRDSFASTILATTCAGVWTQDVPLILPSC